MDVFVGLNRLLKSLQGWVCNSPRPDSAQVLPAPGSAALLPALTPALPPGTRRSIPKQGQGGVSLAQPLVPRSQAGPPPQYLPPNQECPVGLWHPFGVPGSLCPVLHQRHRGRWSVSILRQLQAGLVTQLSTRRGLWGRGARMAPAASWG